MTWHCHRSRRGCCKPAWLSGTTPLFQIPRPVEENGNSISSPENVTPCWLPASCCYGCVFFTVFTQVSLCYPEKQANHPAVNKAMVARHQATGRGSRGTTPGLPPGMDEQCWLPQLITGKEGMFRSDRQGVLSCFLHSVSSVLR